MKVIRRDRYLQRIISLSGNGRVKIITGIRRCGKSFLLNTLFFNYLKEQEIEEDHILYMALDDMLNNKYLNPLELDSYVRGFIKDEKTHYIMLDEIERVFSIINPILTSGKIQLAKNIDENSINFVNVVLGLMQIPNVDLYISGSNSKFLSRDIMTEFRDRGDEIHMQPLSFKEYVDAVQPDNLSLALNEYMLHGGMPVTLSYETAEEKEEYLKHLFSMTYHKDVEERNKIRNEFNLSTLTTVMASTVGSLTNPNKIANTFNTELKSNIGKDMIAQYLNYLEEAFVLRKVNLFDIKGRKHIGATYKYYFCGSGTAKCAPGLPAS